MVLAAIEASLVRMFFYAPNLTSLPDTLLADFSELKRCWEERTGYRLRQAISNIVDGRNVVFYCCHYPLLEGLKD